MTDKTSLRITQISIGLIIANFILFFSSIVLNSEFALILSFMSAQFIIVVTLLLFFISMIKNFSLFKRNKSYLVYSIVYILLMLTSIVFFFGGTINSGGSI